MWTSASRRSALSGQATAARGESVLYTHAVNAAAAAAARSPLSFNNEFVGKKLLTYPAKGDAYRGFVRAVPAEVDASCYVVPPPGGGTEVENGSGTVLSDEDRGSMRGVWVETGRRRKGDGSVNKTWVPRRSISEIIAGHELSSPDARRSRGLSVSAAVRNAVVLAAFEAPMRQQTAACR
eukprot:COSAG06_NODE_2257_length_7222_cov_1.850765_1_plen_179_part_10